MRDYMDDERDRRMDEMYARRSGSATDGGFDDIIEFIVGIIGAFLVVLVIAGVLDSYFGWGLVDWIWGLVYSWTDGVIGKPS